MAVQIELFGNIQYPMINPFLDFMAERLSTGESEFHVAISSPGGNVFSGLTAFNFLKGSGAKIVTHNLGHVHSIAGVIFCAGEERRCVPNGRFLIHDIHWSLSDGNYTETQLREYLEGLGADRTSVAGVLADTMDEEISDVEALMTRGVTWQASEAKERGLVTHIASSVFDPSLPITRFRLD